MTIERPGKLKYRLSGIEGELSPFAGAKVEISGELKDAGSAVMQVEVVRKLSSTCP
jgi:hypothetical protein